jgi:biotin carboxyl carrier protein
MKFDLLLDGKTYEVELNIGKTVVVKLDGVTYKAELDRTEKDIYILLNGTKSHVRFTGSHVSVDGHRHMVEVKNLRRGMPHWSNTLKEVEEDATHSSSLEEPRGEGVVYPPMPGRVIAINVSEGDRVNIGSPILILEAMKMQNELCSKWNGEVREIKVTVGDMVESGDVLMVIGNKP